MPRIPLRRGELSPRLPTTDLGVLEDSVLPAELPPGAGIGATSTTRAARTPSSLIHASGALLSGSGADLSGHLAFVPGTIEVVPEADALAAGAVVCAAMACLRRRRSTAR